MKIKDNLLISVVDMTPPPPKPAPVPAPKPVAPAKVVPKTPTVPAKSKDDKAKDANAISGPKAASIGGGGAMGGL